MVFFYTFLYNKSIKFEAKGMTYTQEALTFASLGDGGKEGDIYVMVNHFHLIYNNTII
ncbi:Uncharacterised protein [Streptococcus macacae NCTC 11558]|nr:Uncharacterised protein [Streptococcus macacae NCTC 11558]